MLGFVENHIWLSLMLFIAALVCLFLLYKLCLRLVRGLKYNRELSEIKKDLNVWKNLADLVKGGSAGDKAKADLSASAKLLSADFKAGMSLLKKRGIIKRRLPVYVLVGEPLSGKSSLLKSGEYGFESLYDQNRDQASKPLVNFYFNSKAVFVDTAGILCFDRYLQSESVEWSLFIKMLFRRHNLHLKGLIVNIPSDALLADSKELCVKKSRLLSLSLQEFANAAMMRVPIYMVIGKCDRLTGFAEFFSGFSLSERNQVFGRVAGGGIPDDLGLSLVKSCFDFQDQSLHSLLNSALLNEFEHNLKNRASFTSSIFLFPKYFRQLEPALKIYAGALLNDTIALKSGNLWLQGIFFTASRSEGLVLNSTLAGILKRGVDEVALHAPAGSNPHSYFCSDLIVKLFFNNQIEPVPFQKLVYIRQFPKIAAGLAMLCCGVILLVGALLDTSGFHRRLLSKTDRADQLFTLFDTGKIKNFALVGLDENGTVYDRFDKSVNGGNITYMDYYRLQVNALSEAEYVPWGLKGAAFLQRSGEDLLLAKREELASALDSAMMYRPVLETLRDKLNSQTKPYVTKDQAAAVKALLNLSDHNVVKNRGNDEYLNDLKAFFKFLLPEKADLLSPYLHAASLRYGDFAREVEREFTFSPGYDKAALSGISAWNQGYFTLSNYPDSDYIVNREAIYQGDALANDYAKLKSLSAAVSGDEDSLSYYVNLASSVIKRAAFIDSHNAELIEKLTAIEQLPLKGQDLQSSSRSDFGADLNLFKNAYLEYKDNLDSDYDFLENKVGYFLTNHAAGVYGGIDLNALSMAIGRRDSYASALLTQYEQVNGIKNRLRDSVLFVAIKDSKGHFTGKFYYELLQEIMSLSLYPIKTMAINSPSDYVKAQEQETDNFKKSWQKLNDCLKDHADSAIAKDIGPLALRMLAAQGEQASYSLIAKLLEFYPDTKNSLVRQALSSYNGPSLFDDSFLQMAQEVLNCGLNAYKAYDLHALSRYLNPFAKLKNLLGDKTLPYADLLQKRLADEPKFSRASGLISEYGNEYLQFWSNFADSLQPEIYSYQDFHQYVSNTRAYQINSVLMGVYEMSYKAVTELDPMLLDEYSAKQQAFVAQSLMAKEKTLNVAFVSLCSKLLSSWAGLSVNAVLANSYVESLSKRQLQEGLLSLNPDVNAKGSIPFYANLINLGSALLKSEAFERGGSLLAAYRDDFLRFPIIKDASLSDQSLSLSKMIDLLGVLKYFEANQEQQEANGEAAYPDDGGDTLLLKLSNRGTDKWASSVRDVINLLTDSVHPVTYEIFIPDADSQTRALKQSGISLPTALSRMRYMSIDSDLVKGSWRSSTFVKKHQGNQNIPVFKTGINDGNLRFDFYQYSDDSKVESSYLIQGDFAILRAYFQYYDYYDETTSSLIFPLTLTDSKGVKSCLFMGIKFSRKLIPLPSWPSTATWPE